MTKRRALNVCTMINHKVGDVERRAKIDKNCQRARRIIMSQATRTKTFYANWFLVVCSDLWTWPKVNWAGGNKWPHRDSYLGFWSPSSRPLYSIHTYIVDDINSIHSSHDKASLVRNCFHLMKSIRWSHWANTFNGLDGVSVRQRDEQWKN